MIRVQQAATDVTVADTATVRLQPVTFTRVGGEPGPGPDPGTRATRAEVEALYRELLGRPADPGGLAHWLATGLSAAAIRARMTGPGPDGAEWRAKHPGTPPPGPGPTPVPIPVPGDATPPAFRAVTHLGYGLVNNYVKLTSAERARMVRACFEAGLTMLEIEGIAWFSEEAEAGLSDRYDIGIIREMGDLCAKYDLTLQFTAVNNNGSRQMANDDAWYRDYIEQVQAALNPRTLPSGRISAILCPVSEPDGGNEGRAAKCRRWTEIAGQVWQGPLVGNGPGGRGTPEVGGYSWTSWHWCDREQMEAGMKGNSYINSTDCGPIINPGPEWSARLARAALDGNTNLSLYDFNGEGVDYETIAAMGAEVQKGGPGTAPYVVGHPGDPPPAPAPSGGVPEGMVLEGNTLVLFDLPDVPDRMRDAGLQGRDTALWYALSRSDWDWHVETPSDEEGYWLKAHQGETREWLEAQVAAGLAYLEAHPEVRAVAIAHDGRDRCGDVLSEEVLSLVPGELRSRVDRGGPIYAD